ncbi:hypothetical protein J6590_054765 [Homalodisca vitripennis]|nr:hypothetical protein J6590_054765 [Homalodisca vitripennis]
MIFNFLSVYFGSSTVGQTDRQIRRAFLTWTDRPRNEDGTTNCLFSQLVPPSRVPSGSDLFVGAAILFSCLTSCWVQTGASMSNCWGWRILKHPRYQSDNPITTARSKNDDSPIVIVKPRQKNGDLTLRARYLSGPRAWTYSTISHRRLYLGLCNAAGTPSRASLAIVWRCGPPGALRLVICLIWLWLCRWWCPFIPPRPRSDWTRLS